MARNRLIWLALAILLLSIPAARSFPPGHILGMDLQNLHAFHTCGAGGNPFNVPGSQCGDIEGRSMMYPPLLYWSFVWLRPLTFDQALHFWTFLSVAALGAMAWFWARPSAQRHGSNRPLVIALALLAMTQMPTAFALERANNDWLVVALWSLSVYWFEKRRYSASGALVGVATLMKVYPALALASMGAGLLAQATAKSTEAHQVPASARIKMVPVVRFLAGAISAAALAFIVPYEQSIAYFFDILPSWARVPSSHPGYHHSLVTTFSQPSWAAWVLFFPLLYAAWTWACSRSVKINPRLIFAGSLAFSTYLSGISYDYNLVTVLPLFWWLVSESCTESNLATNADFDATSKASRMRELRWLLVVAAFAFFGNRLWLRDSHHALQTLQLLGQVGVITWMGVRAHRLASTVS